MPPGKRNALGRYEKTDSLNQDGGFSMPLPKSWGPRIMMMVGLIFLVSPWLFMLIKNNTMTVTGITSKVNHFYDTYFSCYCPNTPDDHNNYTASTTDSASAKAKEPASPLDAFK